jgi:hypothetical protein
MTALTYDTWTEVTTTTVDTLFQAKRGRVEITTIDPTSSNFDDDADVVEVTDQIQINGHFIAPPGLTIWARAVAFPNAPGSPAISFIPWGI